MKLSNLLPLFALLADSTLAAQVVDGDRAPVEAIERAPHWECEEFTVVEEEPSFPGGQEAMTKYLLGTIIYPEEAVKYGIYGTVYVTFMVERDGTLSEVKVIRGIGGGCDEEAIRVIEGMPKWTPGKQRGKFVRVQYNLPIIFKMR